jgi:hypothetical protein
MWYDQKEICCDNEDGQHDVDDESKVLLMDMLILKDARYKKMPNRNKSQGLSVLFKPVRSKQSFWRYSRLQQSLLVYSQHQTCR